MYNRGSHDLLANTTKLLDIKYKFYGSGGDLICAQVITTFILQCMQELVDLAKCEY